MHVPKHLPASNCISTPNRKLSLGCSSNRGPFLPRRGSAPSVLGHGSANAHNYLAGSVVLHWKYVAMESAARERAATTMHHDRSSPQLLLIFAGPPLPSTQRLKIDLQLKWSICNTSFLTIPPRGTKAFQKNHTKHPTYALTSPHWFLIPRCAHALKRKFLPAPFSFYVLFLSGKQVFLRSHPSAHTHRCCSVLVTF